MTTKELTKSIATKERIIQRIEAHLERVLKRFVSDYYKDINALISSLDTDKEGFLKYSGKNISTIQKVPNIHKEIMNTSGVSLAHNIGDNILKLEEANFKFIKKQKPPKISSIRNRITNKLSSLLGYTNGKLSKNGLLPSLIQNSFDVALLNRLTIQIAGGKSLDVVNKSVKTFIVGNRGHVGTFEDMLREQVNLDAYKWDSSIGDGYAKEIGFDWAMYGGDLIEQSREFCIERVGQVFHRKEIELFGTPSDKYEGYYDKSQGKFKGKNENYDPFIDVGGYNCRHVWSWITDDLAKVYRSDWEDFTK